MTKNTFQKISLPASAQQLYSIYMNSKKHAEAIQSKATIESRIGGRFSIFNGWIRGKNLILVPNKLIIQSWRGKDWSKNDSDSVLSLSFENKAKGSTIHLSHLYIPQRFMKEIKQGWDRCYWEPWKHYLRDQRRKL